MWWGTAAQSSRGEKPAVIVGDENLGLWTTVRGYSQAKELLYWNDKMLNVLDAVQKGAGPSKKVIVTP